MNIEQQLVAEEPTAPAKKAHREHVVEEHATQSSVRAQFEVNE